MSNEQKYKPNELPSTITKRLYVSYVVGGYLAGEISVLDFSSVGINTEKVEIHQLDVTIDLPEISTNTLKSKALDMLEAEKQKVLAENHKRLKVVQDKIDNLLAIEYKPESETV